MKKEPLNRRFCVAPMLDCTDKHDRYFMRLISKKAMLYSEMVVAAAIIHGDQNKLLEFNDAEHPLSLQLGGSNPSELAEATKIANDFGYDEINLNIGCPSDRVKSGHFGACLMAEPHLVADCINSIQQVTKLPISVKCRIGIDNQDSDKDLDNFIDVIAETDCKTFIIHARKAWLKGLSPKQNREVPPLNYQRVYNLKKRRNDLEIIINGGIKSLHEVDHHLKFVDGVMLGRAVYDNPYLLAQVDQKYFAYASEIISKNSIIEKFTPYIEEQLKQGVKIHHITRHIIGLFHAVPGAKLWRRHLSVEAAKRPYDIKIIEEAINFIA